MKIELNPIDPLSRLIYDKHKIGANVRSSVPPCTLCREVPEGAVRGHFHGSELGQCKLKTYWDCTSGSTFEDPLEGRVSEDDIDARAAFLLDGHLHEENIIKNIAASGMNIMGYGNQDEYERKIQVYVRYTKNGEKSSIDFTMPHNKAPNRDKVLEGFEESFKIIAHLDGILEVKSKKTGKEMLAGVECKAVKDYTWKKIKETSEISDIWYGQIHSYFISNHHIQRFYLFIKHRHTSQMMKPILIMRNDDYIKRRLTALHDVYSAILDDDPDKYGIKAEHTSPKDSECKFCPYKERCYGKVKVDLNTVYEEEE